ncbi:MAG: SixA phosphatase family protein [Cyanobium sp.]
MAACELLLLRHGIAEERSPDRPDAQRALTAAGRQRTAAVLERLLELDLRCQQLLSSPLLRARQTAELAVAAGLAPELQLVEGLAPAGDPWPLLRWPAGVHRLALVGHEPDLAGHGRQQAPAAPAAQQVLGRLAAGRPLQGRLRQGEGVQALDQGGGLPAAMLLLLLGQGLQGVGPPGPAALLGARRRQGHRQLFPSAGPPALGAGRRLQPGPHLHRLAHHLKR